MWGPAHEGDHASVQVGAAVLGVPVKPTIKEVDAARIVVKTLTRARLWEVQTPQVNLYLQADLPSRCHAVWLASSLMLAPGIVNHMGLATALGKQGTQKMFEISLHVSKDSADLKDADVVRL